MMSDVTPEILIGGVHDGRDGRDGPRGRHVREGRPHPLTVTLNIAAILVVLGGFSAVLAFSSERTIKIKQLDETTAQAQDHELRLKTLERSMDEQRPILQYLARRAGFYDQNQPRPTEPEPRN